MVEEWVERAMDGVMQKPVTHRGFVDVAWFGVGNIEGMIATMCIYFVCEISVECEDIIEKMILEELHIGFVSFATDKLAPCVEQVFNGNDMLVCMSELSPIHTPKVTPPPNISQPKLVPVVLKLKDAYGIWQSYLAHFLKANRFTLGSKIDDVFLATIEYCFLASYANIAEKPVLVDRAISRTDLIKLLLQLAWDIGALDNKKYVYLSTELFEIGRMLGGWKRQIASKTPVHTSREK